MELNKSLMFVGFFFFFFFSYVLSFNVQYITTVQSAHTYILSIVPSIHEELASCSVAIMMMM